MVIKRTWVKQKGNFFPKLTKYTGYFLFGFIPLFIAIEEVR